MAKTTSFLDFHITSWNVTGQFKDTARHHKAVKRYLREFAAPAKSPPATKPTNVATVHILCLQDTREQTSQGLISQLNAIGISANNGFDGTVTPARPGGKPGGVALIWRSSDSQALTIKMSRIQLPDGEFNHCRQFARCQVFDEDDEQLKNILICGLLAVPKHEPRFFKEQKWMLSFLYEEYKFNHCILCGDFNKSQNEIQPILKLIGPNLQLHPHSPYIYTTQRFTRQIRDYVASDLPQMSFRVDHLPDKRDEHYPLRSRISLQFDEITEQFMEISPRETKPPPPYFDENPLKLEEEVFALQMENNAAVLELKQRLAECERLLSVKEQSLKQSGALGDQLKDHFVDVIGRLQRQKQLELQHAVGRHESEIDLLQTRLIRLDSKNQELEEELRSRTEELIQLQEQTVIQSSRWLMTARSSGGDEGEQLRLPGEGRDELEVYAGGSVWGERGRHHRLKSLL